ncbi:winged helix-turn-helix transcriptional regulator [Micromonospora endophytica]|uniref:HxlR family transcriptional regulator n=1 Tax=Micromonospora endophytica TaxID=515350 RepID=A0A2W2CF86_9ACTN|nr:helix-turn-helix domain-containing protein [Micromonospora endophytica]PZF98075.1 HxlR family transcriptional regulator [Micromonospora endophytica]RIW49477.1 transcriptional regulator [Micromonospora endophytica]BCJ62510.1 transcriptional regulator [Micromonospora endophytica]
MRTRPERRTYDQQCGLAFALDLVGERWTLLIVREFLLGPRRYRELLEALPGIGTNLLADRLAALTAAGILRPVDEGRRTGGYELTERGERLREPVLAMARFGLALLAEQRGPRASVVRASWAVLAVEAMVDPVRALAEESYEFQIDAEVFHVSVEGGGAVRTRLGPAEAPALRVMTDARTFFDVGSGLLDPVEALLTGVVRVDGAATAVRRCMILLGLLGNEQHGEPVSARPEG